MKVQLENLVRHMYKSGLRYPEAVREFRKGFILTVLKEANGNQVWAAGKLGIHRNSGSRHSSRDVNQPIPGLVILINRKGTGIAVATSVQDNLFPNVGRPDEVPARRLARAAACAASVGGRRRTQIAINREKSAAFPSEFRILENREMAATSPEIAWLKMVWNIAM